MTAMLSGALAAQRHALDLDMSAAGRVESNLRRSRSTRAAEARARNRLGKALARREAQDRQVGVVGLAP